jgi:hypothetical protein
LLSIVISILATLPFTHPNDDLGIGFLWILIFVATASLCLPCALASPLNLSSARLSRRFTWAKALLRSLSALPIPVGPAYAYAALSVAPFVENRRPVHWVKKEILAYALFAASAYVALRIRKQPPQPAQ